ncbi:hypothetical protein V6N13_124260 [Hibiscus sabdariffa]|uniref:Phytosulfokine n=1 Tax=Hibiscus sabdariffa TaxID=183260 RepID=A0ABR2S0Z4_9ROSI
MSSKVSACCMIVFLLFFTLSSTSAARPDPTTSQVQHPNTPAKTQNLDTGTERVEVDDICQGIKEDEEECLMRRTLAAHVDYIYTQKANP